MKMSSRNTRLLLVGDGFSTFGSWIDFLAILTLAAYSYHVSPYQMALIAAAGVLPGILCAPWIGKLCDYRNPKVLLLASLLIRVTATTAILLTQNYYIFLALVSLRSVFASVLFPAVNVLAVRCVGIQERGKFYSSLSVINSVAKVAAPMIGTISSSLGTEKIALIMSIVLTGISFITFFYVHLSASAAKETLSDETPASAISLAPLLYLGSVYAFYVHMVNNLIPVILERAGHDKALLGILVGCAGAGNILSGLWLRNKPPPQDIGLPLIIRPALLQAAGFFALGQVIGVHSLYTPVALAVLFFGIGIFATRHSILLSVYCSERYADAMGSAIATLQSFQNLMLLIAPLAGAFILDHLGAGALFTSSVFSALIGYALVGLVSSAKLKTISA